MTPEELKDQKQRFFNRLDDLSRGQLMAILLEVFQAVEQKHDIEIVEDTFKDWALLDPKEESVIHLSFQNWPIQE